MPKPKIIRVIHHQTGRTNLPRDVERIAFPPGVRESRTGHRYTETRANRSDKSQQKRI